ncbi:MAG: hypothetical protein ACK5Y2_04080 [Bdellovibrionales bacterium]
MVSSKRGQRIRFLVFFLSVSALIIVFQNCSQSGFSSNSVAFKSTSEDVAPPPWVPQEAIKPQFQCRNVSTNQPYSNRIELDYGHFLECRATTFNNQLRGFNRNLTNGTQDNLRILDMTNGWTYLGNGQYQFPPLKRDDYPSTTRFQVFVQDSNGLQNSVELIFKGLPQVAYAWNDSGATSCAQRCGAQTVPVDFICLRNDGARVDDSLCPQPKPQSTRICYHEPRDVFRDLVRNENGSLYNEICTCSTLGAFAGNVIRMDELNRRCYQPFAGCATDYRLVNGVCVK